MYLCTDHWFLYLGWITFLDNLFSASICLYCSYDTSRDSSNTPGGIAKGLILIGILPVAGTVRLRSTILLLDLAGITHYEDILFCVLLGDLDLVDSHLIHEGWDNFPADRNSHWGIDNPKLEKSATIILGHFCDHGLEDVARNLSNSQISQIVDDTPALNLARDEHMLDNLLMQKDCGF